MELIERRPVGRLSLVFPGLGRMSLSNSSFTALSKNFIAGFLRAAG